VATSTGEQQRSVNTNLPCVDTAKPIQAARNSFKYQLSN